MILFKHIEQNISLMYAFRFLQKMSFSLPIQIIYFSAITQNYAMAMGLYAISHLITVALELPTGCLSDKWGRKWVCVLGAFGLFLSSIFYAVADTYLVLICAAILAGINKALASGNDETLLYETMNELKRKKDYLNVLSKVTSLGQFALCISAVVGGLLALISLKVVMYISIIPTGFAFVVSLFFVEPKHLDVFESSVSKHIWVSIKHLFQNKRLRYLTLGEACHHGLSEAAFMFNSIFFKLFVPVWSLGIFRALGHLCGSIGSYMSYKITNRFGIERTFLWGAALNNIINIISVLSASILSPILKLGSSFVNSMKDPPTSTLIHNEIPNNKRATVLSLASLMNSGMYAICTVFVGALADMYSPYCALLTAYTLALFSNILFVKALAYKSAYNTSLEEERTEEISD